MPRQARDMLDEPIFYSFRIHNDLQYVSDPSLFNNIYNSCKDIKDSIINFLKHEGMITHEIIRPEIYKHDISFQFLPNFKKGSFHLIFKPFEHIRILKNAYNILVVSWEFETIHMVSQNDIPFTNHYRMLSLLDEIWLFSNRQKDIMSRHHLINTHLISEGTADREISHHQILDRLHSIKREGHG